jgi:MoaA/NifB/PqqE/SkfB family radical SAM enzyme
MFDFTDNFPLPDHGLFGVRGAFAKIFLELTSLCNNRCVFCVSWQKPAGPRGTMSKEDMERVFTAIPDFRGSVILHMGGEAFILPDLPERCALIKRHWPHCRLHMTSTFNVDHGREYLATLVASGLDSLCISCYGYDREDYRKIHGNDAFEALCRNIERLGGLPERRGKDLTLNVMDNVECFLSIRDHVRKKEAFVAFASANGIAWLDRMSGDSRQGRLPTGNIPSGSDATTEPSSIMPAWPCDVVWGERAGELIIGWNLNILPCCAIVSHDMVLGNLRESSLEVIFSSDLYRRFYQQHWSGALQDFPLCRACTTRHRGSSPEELMRFIARQADILEGREVYFWGCGEAWRRYGNFFSRTKPLAMLLDMENALPAEIAGLPVFSPSVALHPDQKIPLVIFASPPNNRTIAETISGKYPWIAPEDIFWAPPVGLTPEWSYEAL